MEIQNRGASSAVSMTLEDRKSQVEPPLLERVERAEREIEDLRHAVVLLETAMKRVLGATFRAGSDEPVSDPRRKF